MPRIVDSILMELDQEAATTKRVLERVPGDKLGWKPHEKLCPWGNWRCTLRPHPEMSPA